MSIGNPTQLTEVSVNKGEINYANIVCAIRLSKTNKKDGTVLGKKE